MSWLRPRLRFHAVLHNKKLTPQNAHEDMQVMQSGERFIFLSTISETVIDLMYNENVPLTPIETDQNIFEFL